MTYQALAERARASMLPGAAAALAVAIFVADALTPPDCVVGGLYVIVVLIAGRFCGARALWLVAAACAALTVLAQCLAHRLVAGNDAAAYIGAFNTSVSIVAIVMSTYLIRRGQSAEAALQGAQTDLARVSRVTTLGELTASIAHEVNQPIAAAVTNASACLRWLAGEPPDLEQARAAAARIVRDGSRAAEIVSRIRVMFAKGDGDRGPVELNQLARETLDLLGSEAARHAVAVRTDLMRGLPVVRADRVQVQQVLVNLVLNAFDAMKDIDGPRDLTVRSRRTRDEVEVSVADTGVGLPAQPSLRIFDAFVTTKAQGTGMGLSISRSIIESHQGRLRAEPNPGGGAVFAFSLPIEGETPFAPDPG
jgi:C4-dicarboxylate-specific signal transduction histidine kinase